MNSQYSQFVHQTKTLLWKNLNFPISKIYVSIDPEEEKKPNRVPKKLYTKFNFSPFIVKNSLFAEYIYIYKKKNSPRKTHSLSIFFFILPLDIHRGKEAFSTNAANRVCTPECTNSTYNSWHKFDVHSLIPFDVNASSYEKRKGRSVGIALELVPRILIRVSSLRYRFNTPWSDCTLRLHVQSLRPTATNQDQDGEKEGEKGEGWLLLEENQSSSLRNRLSSEGDREYNKQRSLRGRRQSRRRAQHPHSCNPLRNRCTDLPFRKYILSKGDGFAEKAAAKERHLNSYVLW